MDPFSQLAKKLLQRWDTFIGGDYAAPPCPPASLLASLLRLGNYAAAVPEEGRYPKFNIAAYRAGDPIARLLRLDEPRDYNVAELRRLIPATDSRKSAVCVEWDTSDALRIVGIQDLGTAWKRTQEGLAYHFDERDYLSIEVERPNRLAVYQRQFRVATFSDGRASVWKGMTLHTFLHDAVHGGLEALTRQITPPRDEPPSEYQQFEFLALWNCYAAIANLVAARGHGGTLIVVPTPNEALTPLLRRKYSLHGTELSEAFVAFMNARHKTMNEYWRRDLGKRVSDKHLALLDWTYQHAQDNLVESTRLVAQLAQCDGALVISRALDILGFGTEIAAELRKNCTLKEVVDEHRRKYRPLDVEQFGMRHRSAIKLASQIEGVVVLVISQDGPISAIWRDDSSVYVHKGVRLVNINAPWA